MQIQITSFGMAVCLGCLDVCFSPDSLSARAPQRCVEPCVRLCVRPVRDRATLPAIDIGAKPLQWSVVQGETRGGAGRGETRCQAALVCLTHALVSLGRSHREDSYGGAADCAAPARAPPPCAHAN
jgi:hypothetical protein